MTSIERKYQMIRLGAGDYLLPSNDAQTLWRIYSYQEDGSLWHSEYGKPDKQVVGMFWAVAKWNRGFPEVMAFFDREFLEWDNWDFCAGPLLTRREAIGEAMR